jgi:hypothetical protein
MVRRKKTPTRKKKKPSKVSWLAAHIRGILIFTALLLLLAVSVFAVAYVIFFRTVFVT